MLSTQETMLSGSCEIRLPPQKYRSLFTKKMASWRLRILRLRPRRRWLWEGGSPRRQMIGSSSPDNIISQRPLGEGDLKELREFGVLFKPRKGALQTVGTGLRRLAKAARLYNTSGNVLRYVRMIDDYPVVAMNNLWRDTIKRQFH